MSSEELKLVRIQDIVSKLGDGLHGTPKYDENGGYFFINGNNLIDGKIVIKESTQKISEIEYNKYKKELNDRTILLGINGTIGNVALYNNEKCILGKSACYFNVLKTVDKNFIKYVIMDRSFQTYIENFASGSTIKNVSLKLIREYEFILPSFEKQQRIGLVLSSLDDRIELNRQTNQTLEGIAQTLFQEMCVPKGEELPEGWRTGILFDICKLIGGGTPKTDKNEYWDNGTVGWISAKDITPNNGSFITQTEKRITELGLKNSSAKLLPSLATIISARGTVGNVCIISKPMTISQSNYAFIAIAPQTEYYLFCIVRSLVNELKQRAYGTIFDTITTVSLSDLEVVIPPKNTLLNFNNIISPIFEHIKKNIQENQTLIALRDSLLPKLMKGEIKI